MARWIAFAMLILAVGVVVWTLRSPTQGPPPATAIRTPTEIEPPAPPDRPERDEAVPGAATESKGMVVLIPESDPEDAIPAVAAPTVRMPIAAKLAGVPLSEVEHELVGAWDDDPEGADPGVHRTFVAIVDPKLPIRELETLVRDIADRHRSAEVLDVRIYDSRSAAETPPLSDGGKARLQHLVAQIVRNDRLGYDQITVRGQPIVR